MTKYILHGGASKRETEDNKKFFREIADSLPNSAEVLVVCYMMVGKDWPEVLKADKRKFSSAAPDKKLNLVLADTHPDVFRGQLKSADAVYLHGGNTHILKEYPDKIPNLENLWQGKIIAGTSAGALVLTKYWYENDDDTYNQGLGILPFKLFCHYSEEKADKLKKLKAFGDNSEVRIIPEEEFFVFKQ